MQSHSSSRRYDARTLPDSPRCILNCNGLSMHLPPLNDQRVGSEGEYITPPMSASYTTKFDDRIPLQSHGYRHSAGNVPPYASSSTKQGNPSMYTQKTSSKSGRNELTASANSKVSLGSYATNDRHQHPTLSWKADAVPESQLVPGPPGIARRAKAHVPSACVNCKKKHLACETKRPCNRCISNGKESSCIDVQHKKRGRPRLREDDTLRDINVNGAVQYGDTLPPSGTADAPIGRQKSKTYRELRSQPETTYLDNRSMPMGPIYASQAHYSGSTYGYASPTTSSYPPTSLPLVLLTPDFVVAQHNRAFSDALSLQTSVRGQKLTELVVSAEKEKIRRVQAVLRSELQHVLHSAHRNGSAHATNTMPAIERLDVVRATAGFQTRSEYWTFRLPRDQNRGFPVSISLARDGGHFIVLTLIQSTSLTSMTSPQIMQQGSFFTSPPIGGMPSPPHSLYQGHRYDRSSPPELGMSYASSALPNGYEDQLLSMYPAHSLAQYKHNSPPRSVQMSAAPYGTPRTSCSSSASPPGSDMPRGSSSHSNGGMARDSLKHLQLPPIRTNPTSDPTASGEHDRSRRHQNQTPSPARGSPHSSKRKKRRRVEIGDMLH